MATDVLPTRDFLRFPLTVILAKTRMRPTHAPRGDTPLRFTVTTPRGRTVTLRPCERKGRLGYKVLGPLADVNPCNGLSERPHARAMEGTCRLVRADGRAWSPAGSSATGDGRRDAL